MNLSGLQGDGLKGIQEFYESVDLMLVVGARIRGHELGEFSGRAAGQPSPDRCRPAGQRPRPAPQHILPAAMRG